MRIGITCYPTYGGSGIVATELGLELAARGHEIHFITYANPIRLDPGLPRIHYHEVEVSAYPLFLYPPYCLALASRMAEVAENYDLDLLHVHYAIPHSIAAMLAQQMVSARKRLPFITALHVPEMPREMESFGLAALEGMACGVPPVATRVGGVPELITHGVDGFLEAVGDIPRLAARATE